MSIADDVASELPNFRVEAESLMLDSCTVERSLGITTDPITGQVSDAVEAVYEGACKIQSFNARGVEPVAGGHKFLEASYQVHFPYGADAEFGITTGDVVNVVTAHNSRLGGLRFRLTEPDLKTHSTADRWNAELVLS